MHRRSKLRRKARVACVHIADKTGPYSQASIRASTRCWSHAHQNQPLQQDWSFCSFMVGTLPVFPTMCAVTSCTFAGLSMFNSAPEERFMEVASISPSVS